MTLNNLGQVYECKEGVLRMNTAVNPVKHSIVLTELGRVQPYDTEAEKDGDHTIINARSVFTLVESFIFDIQWAVENNTLKTYWQARNGLTIAQKWNVFTMLVDANEWQFIIDAYTATRPTAAMENETDTTKKKHDSQDSEQSTPNATAKPTKETKTA